MADSAIRRAVLSLLKRKKVSTFDSPMKKTIIILLCMLAAPSLHLASAREPMLSIFRENYAVTGIPLNAKPDWNTNDVAYQISVRFNLLQDMRGKEWDAFIGYTQLSVWDVYRPSNPFRSHIYNPGVYVHHPFTKDKYGIKSDILFGWEHRSNGLDSKESRSVNYLFGTYTHRFGANFTAQATARFGVGSIGNYTSFEIYRYLGFVNFGLCYHSSDRRFQASASVTPLIGCDIPLNCNAELAWNPSRRAEWLYLVARYHYGYDENQLDCASEDVFLKHMLRFGIAVQPRLLSQKLYQ